MMNLSSKTILMRYGLATLLLWLAVLARQPDAFYFVIFAAIVCLKFPIYDAAAYILHRKWPTLRVSPWLIIGYSAALILDIAATWASASGETDAGLGFLVTIFYTPWVLVGALGVMVVRTLIDLKRR